MRPYRWPLVIALVIAAAAALYPGGPSVVDLLIRAVTTFVIFFLPLAGIVAYINAYRREHPPAAPKSRPKTPGK